MAITQSAILAFEARAPIRKSAELIREAKAAKKETAFLCHSHHDSRLAKSLQAFLHANGWEVYIDWDDTTMPDRPNRETAERLQAKIRDLDWFLFLATRNSMQSRWCPWELGYADGAKSYHRILILPTSDAFGSHGNEYLDLYRHLDSAQGGGYGAFLPNRTGIKIAGLSIQ
jgi:hypothetical protein